MTTLPVSEQTLVGRITGGDVDDLTVAQVSTLLGIGVGSLAPTGAIAQNFPRNMVSNASLGAANSGWLRMYAIYLPICTVTSVSIAIGATNLAGGTHGWGALFDVSRNLLKQSTDDTGVTCTANTYKTFTLSSTQAITTAGVYYVGILFTTASTMPSLDGAVMLTTDAAATTAPILCGNSTTGLTATAPNPAGAITPIGGMAHVYVS